MGTVQTSMVIISNLKHESSNLTHSGTDGEGSKKQKKHKKTLPGFPRPHLTYVGCPERAPPPGILFHMRYTCEIKLSVPI